MPEEGTDLTPKDALLTTSEILRLVITSHPYSVWVSACSTAAVAVSL